MGAQGTYSQQSVTGPQVRKLSCTLQPSCGESPTLPRVPSAEQASVADLASSVSLPRPGLSRGLRRTWLRARRRGAIVREKTLFRSRSLLQLEAKNGGGQVGATELGIHQGLIVDVDGTRLSFMQTPIPSASDARPVGPSRRELRNR